MKKLAIIGCGGIGRYHLDHFLQFRDIELAGFCDIILERAEVFAKAAGSGQGFTDYKEMYDAVQPDMVFICIPPYAHGDIEFETIRRRIPFFVEKPVALSLDLAHEIRQRIQEAGLITASGFQCRYSNLVEPTVEFIQDHEIVFIDCVRVGGIPGTEWWKKRALSGGQIVEQTIHQFDIIRYVFGEPDTVFTMGTKGYVTDVDGYDTEDLTTTVVRFQNGALAAISTGCYASAGASADSKVTFGARDSRADLYILDKLRVFEEKQAAVEDSSLVVKGDGAMNGKGTTDTVYRQEGDSGLLCDRTFIDAVLSGDPSKIRSPYEDAVRSLAFTLACNESLDTGLPVKVNLD
ncbi:MAG: Gfo/Idh/MocA family protein [Clostridia bacterium]